MTVWAGRQAQAAMCKGIEVEVKGGDPRLLSTTQKGITNEVLRWDSHLLKKRVSSINTLDLRNHLSRISNFEEVHCTMTSQGKLRITVVPMIPELRVFDNNESYYINKDGKRIRATAQFYADVPVVRGHFTDEFPAKSILPVVRFVRNDSTLRHLVSMFEANDAQNILLIPRITGHVVNFGDTLNLVNKRRALLAMYRKVLPYKGWETYDTISVRFRGQVVATLRNKSAGLHPTVNVEELDLEEAALQAHEESQTPAPVEPKVKTPEKKESKPVKTP